MKKFVISLLACVVLSGCSQAQPGVSVGVGAGMGPVRAVSVQTAAQTTNKETPDDAPARMPEGHFRLDAIKLKGQDGINNYFIVNIGKGFTKAMVKDEPASIVKKNPDWYEITTKEYIIGVYLDDKGFMSSSWNRHKGRDHGQLFPVEGE